MFRYFNDIIATIYIGPVQHYRQSVTGRHSNGPGIIAKQFGRTAGRCQIGNSYTEYLSLRVEQSLIDKALLFHDESI
jgi:hypothetical protein